MTKTSAMIGGVLFVALAATGLWGAFQLTEPAAPPPPPECVLVGLTHRQPPGFGEWSDEFLVTICPSAGPGGYIPYEDGPEVRIRIVGFGTTTGVTEVFDG